MNNCRLKAGLCRRTARTHRRTAGMHGCRGRTKFACGTPSIYMHEDNVSATAKNQYTCICAINIIFYFCMIAYKDKQYIIYTDVYLF